MNGVDMETDENTHLKTFLHVLDCVCNLFHSE